ncbi:MAG: hypothetical protein ACRDHB_03555 [Actinomycetota bacterium]
MWQSLGIGKARAAALLVVGTLIGASVLAPTVGMAARFLTKKKADKRYLNTNEVLVAGATADTLISMTSTSFESLLSTPITAPSNGSLLIVGDVNAAVAARSVALRLRLDATPVTNEPAAHTMGTPSAIFLNATNGLTATVPVATGPHTVHLDGRMTSSGSSSISGRSLSVLFVPSGGGVSIPV